MAKTEAVEKTVEKTVEKAVKTVAKKPTYTVEEFAKAPKSLGEKVTSDIVIATFACADKKEATVDEAKELVKTFMRKEIK